MNAATVSTKTSSKASPPRAAGRRRSRKAAAGPVVGATRLTQSDPGGAHDFDDRLRLRMRLDECVGLRRHELAEGLTIAGGDFDALLLQRLHRLLFGFQP